MKKHLLILLAATTLTVQAQSPAPTKSKHIDDLHESTEDFLIMGMINKQLDKSLQDMANKMKVSGAQEQAVVDEYRAKIRSEVEREISAADVKSLYLENFTEKQIQDLSEFFKTDTGKLLLKNMQEVVTTSSTAAQETMKEISPRIQLFAMQMATAIQELRTEKNEIDGPSGR